MRLVVDGTNVMGSRPDGWWRDRPGAARRLVAQLVAMRRAVGPDLDECTVVFDGKPFGDLPEGAASELATCRVAGSEASGVDVVVVWARRRGPDAADDRIVEWLAAHEHASAVTVVTSDRRLAERARQLGSAVVGAGWLLDRVLLDRALLDRALLDRVSEQDFAARRRLATPTGSASPWPGDQNCRTVPPAEQSGAERPRTATRPPDEHDGT